MSSALASRRLAMIVGCALGLGSAAAQQAGDVDAELKISQASGGFAGDLDNDDNFGASVAAVGDLDGDGHGDLLAGAPRDDDDASQAGALWVLLLDEDGAVRLTRKISATQGTLGAPLHENDHLGMAVAALGDVDGDGVPDAAVGIPGSDAETPQSGLVRVLSNTRPWSPRPSSRTRSRSPTCVPAPRLMPPCVTETGLPSSCRRTSNRRGREKARSRYRTRAG